VEETGLIETIEANEAPSAPVNTEHTIKEGSLSIRRHESELLFESKLERCEEVDKRTDELFSLGYTYNGKKFSLSEKAQLRILSALNDPGVFYPFEIATLDNSESETMESIEDVRAINLAISSKINEHVGKGSDLKNQINGALDEDALELIIDNR